MSSHLTQAQLEKLKVWLNIKKINPINLPKDFSDGVLMAKLLSELFPRLVEMHNYAKVSSIQRKIANWETLNLKVLRRLNIQQRQSTLRELASATPGVIEMLLYRIMKAEQDGVFLKTKAETSDLEGDILQTPQGTIMVNISRQIGDGLIQIPQQVVLYSEYKRVVKESESMEAELKELEEAVIERRNHVKQLDSLIEARAERLSKLTAAKSWDSISKDSGTDSSRRGRISGNNPITPKSK